MSRVTRYTVLRVFATVSVIVGALVIAVGVPLIPSLVKGRTIFTTAIPSTLALIGVALVSSGQFFHAVMDVDEHTRRTPSC